MKNTLTPELLKAFNHVREKYPEVTTVVINKKGHWCYMDDDFESPTFTKRLDVGLLEDGAASIKSLPFVYQMDLVE